MTVHTYIHFSFMCIVLISLSITCIISGTPRGHTTPWRILTKDGLISPRAYPNSREPLLTPPQETQPDTLITGTARTPSTFSKKQRASRQETTQLTVDEIIEQLISSFKQLPAEEQKSVLKILKSFMIKQTARTKKRTARRTRKSRKVSRENHIQNSEQNTELSIQENSDPIITPETLNKKE